MTFMKKNKAKNIKIKELELILSSEALITEQQNIKKQLTEYENMLAVINQNKLIETRTREPPPKNH